MPFLRHYVRIINKYRTLTNFESSKLLYLKVRIGFEVRFRLDYSGSGSDLAKKFRFFY